MTSRIASAAVGLPLLALLVWVGAPWLTLLVAAAAAAGALELCGLARQRGMRPVAPLATAWAVTIAAGAQFLEPGSALVAVVPAMVAVGALAYATAMARRPRPCDRLGDWAVTAGAPLLIGGLLSFGVLLRELDQGREWMLLAVLVTAASDSSAFFIGRAIGKTRLAPTISPGKTWEGAFGGLLGAGGAAAASVFVLGLDATLVEALVLGALMGVVGQVGDLAESWTKRAAGAKDSGWLIPGHGGILDRLDSFVFNLVLLYYFVVWAVQ